MASAPPRQQDARTCRKPFARQSLHFENKSTSCSANTIHFSGTNMVGRGAYDTTDGSNHRSAMASIAINLHATTRAETQRKQHLEQAAELDLKLLKSKKDRSIKNAKREANKQTQQAAKPSQNK